MHLQFCQDNSDYMELFNLDTKSLEFNYFDEQTFKLALSFECHESK
jgi:hypothetical protein